MFQSMENVETLKSYMKTVKDYFTIVQEQFTQDKADQAPYITRYGNMISITNFNLGVGEYTCTIQYGSRYLVPFAHLTNAQMDTLFPKYAPHSSIAEGTGWTIGTTFSKVNTGAEQNTVFGMVLVKRNGVWYLASSSYGSTTQNAKITSTGYTSFPMLTVIQYNRPPLPDLPTIP